MMVRRGHTLVELLVALPLAALLAALVITTVIAQLRLARNLAERVSRAEAERLVAGLLPAELHWAGAADLRSAGTDSVRARIFRGFGLPCGDGRSVAWTGLRAPAPQKDSALIITSAGEAVAAVAAARPASACAGYELQLAQPHHEGVLLVFETGTYYLRDAALRFRVGGEGRQPLTDEWFLDSGTALLRDANGRISRLQLTLLPLRAAAASSPNPVEVRRLSWALPNHP